MKHMARFQGRSEQESPSGQESGFARGGLRVGMSAYEHRAPCEVMKMFQN